MCNHSHEVPDADKNEIKEVTRIILRDMAIIVGVLLLIITLAWSLGALSGRLDPIVNKEKPTAVTK